MSMHCSGWGMWKVDGEGGWGKGEVKESKIHIKYLIYHIRPPYFCVPYIFVTIVRSLHSRSKNKSYRIISSFHFLVKIVAIILTSI